jgi:hypothetical protein
MGRQQGVEDIVVRLGCECRESAAISTDRRLARPIRRGGRAGSLLFSACVSYPPPPLSRKHGLSFLPFVSSSSRSKSSASTGSMYPMVMHACTDDINSPFECSFDRGRRARYSSPLPLLPGSPPDPRLVVDPPLRTMNRTPNTIYGTGSKLLLAY